MSISKTITRSATIFSDTSERIFEPICAALLSTRCSSAWLVVGRRAVGIQSLVTGFVVVCKSSLDFRSSLCFPLIFLAASLA